MRRASLSTLGLLVSAAAIFIVVRSVDLGGTIDTLRTAQGGLIVAALPLVAVGIVLRSWRWQRLIRSAGRTVPVLRIVPVLLIGYLGNAVLPARLGEPIRAYLLARRERLSAAHVFGTALLERIVDLAALAAIAFVASVALGAPAWAVQLTGITALGGAAILVLLATIGIERPIRLLDRLLPARAGRATWLLAAAGRFAAGLGGGGQRASIGQASLLSVPIWLLDGVICLVLGQALGIHLALAASMLIVGIGALGTSIPSAPGYLGTYELAASSMARGLGVSPEAALGLALLVHATTLASVAIGGAASLLLIGNQNLFQLSRAASEGEKPTV